MTRSQLASEREGGMGTLDLQQVMPFPTRIRCSLPGLSVGPCGRRGNLGRLCHAQVELSLESYRLLEFAQTLELAFVVRKPIRDDELTIASSGEFDPAFRELSTLGLRCIDDRRGFGHHRHELCALLLVQRSLSLPVGQEAKRADVLVEPGDAGDRIDCADPCIDVVKM